MTNENDIDIEMVLKAKEILGKYEQENHKAKEFHEPYKPSKQLPDGTIRVVIINDK